MHKPATPLVSAIVRSMERPTLAEALDSIAAQTYPRLEIVLVNAKGPRHRLPDDRHGTVPLRFVDHGEPLTRGRAANAGLDAAQGELLFFLDDDDLLFPEHVAALVSAWAAQPDMRGAYSGIRVEHYRDEQLVSVGVQNQAFDRHRLWGRNFLPIHAVLFESSLLALGCRVDESLEVYEDWDFWVQVTARTDLAHVDLITACYRNHGQSGFGLQADEAFTRRAKAAFFDKWRKRWSGEQLSDLIECREAVMTACTDRSNLQQEALAQQALRLDEQSNRITQLQQQFDLAQGQIRQSQEHATSLRQEIQLRVGELAESRALADQRQHEVRATQQQLQSAQQQLQSAQEQLQSAQQQLRAMLQSRSWRLMAPYRWIGTSWRRLRKLRKLRTLGARYAAEQGWLMLLRRTVHIAATHGPRGLLAAVRRYAGRTLPGTSVAGQIVTMQAVVRHPVGPHKQPVDVIVCVHNALDDVRNCLGSVLRNTGAPYHLILVDDGSRAPTRDHLAAFAAAHGATLIRNEVARGYTMAANQGMAQSQAPFVVLLNSDTIVSAGWLDRLVACAASDPALGIVGPLSNTASWQSIPQIEHLGDWSTNPLPEGLDVAGMARLVADFSGQTYPRIPLLNGFCLLIKREVIERIGTFDEVAFAKGYGEENDFCLRAGKAGFTLAVADDVYVFHAQSKSYSTERRKQLSDLAGIALARKHGQALIDAGVAVCRHDRVMEGLRAHATQLFERHRLAEEGRRRFAGRRLLFVLPVSDPGGGANVVICEARALRRMGVQVELVNFERSRAAFEANYPRLDFPVRYAVDEAAIPALCQGADAVIATLNTSVFWIAPLQHGSAPRPALGYYIQDFEPNFYAEGSAGHQTALASYTAVPEMVCVTKTPWNADVVRERTGRQCTVLGPSFDGDLFRPRPRTRASWPHGPLRVTAMIRPSSPRRGPRLTMEILREVEHEFRGRIEVLLFGVDAADPEFRALPHDFAWQNAGSQSAEQMATLLNDADIFVDFSHYQAMGLTAMEAMACGAAVVLPQAGGADSFARHEHDALLVDTSDVLACRAALRRLLTDDELRLRLQRQAVFSIAQHVPEKPALRLLSALFGSEDDGRRPPTPQTGAA